MMQMPAVYRLVEDLVEMHGAPHSLFSNAGILHELTSLTLQWVLRAPVWITRFSQSKVQQLWS
jgi:hypothetical protein